MTKLLCIGDVHLAKSPPGRREDTYFEDILAKLDHTVVIAREQQVDAVVFVGDLFHNPRADRVPYVVTKALSQRLLAYGVPVYVDPGNHDMRHGDLEGVFESQPIALLDDLDPVTVMRWTPVEIPGTDVVLHPIPGVPHIEVEGYLGHEQLAPCGTDPDKFHFYVVHQAIARDGADSLPYDCVGADELAAALDYPDLIWYGHLHEDFGWYEVGGKKFVNFGSVCRGTINESDVKKEPKVFVLTTEGHDCSFEQFSLPYRPAEEAFKLEEYLDEKAKSEQMEEFVASIQRISVQTFSLDTVISSITTREDVEEAVRNYTIDCIHRVRAA